MNAKVENDNQIPDMEECTEIADALVQLGVVIDEDDRFIVDEQKLLGYPHAVHEFVKGMCLLNNPTN